MIRRWWWGLSWQWQAYYLVAFWVWAIGVIWVS